MEMRDKYYNLDLFRQNLTNFIASFIEMNESGFWSVGW